MRKSIVLSFALFVGGCFDTSYHLVTPGDEHTELTGAAAAPDNWQMPGFNDSAWKRGMGQAAQADAGAAVYERFVFAVGADTGSMASLSLSLPGDGHYTAFINGVQMTGSGTSRSLAMTPGLLRPSGNVLALLITSSTANPSVSPTVDGTGGTAPAGPRITRGPYLLSPTAGGATIVWDTSEATPSVAVVDGRHIDGGSANRHIAVVTGLQPSQSYPYHVEVGTQKSPDNNLVTTPRAGEPVRFAVFGDNRTNGDAHRRLVNALTGEAPDFVVNTGDMVGESNDSEWKMFFDIEYPLIANSPLIPAIGNHETDYGDSSLFAQVMPEPGAKFKGRVYSIDYGDLHFAMLDSNGELDEQRSWLEADLTAAEGRGARHKFIVMHWGPWCGVNKASHGNNSDAIDNIVPVAKAHGVAAVFSGHNHVYERGADGNLRYVVAGGGGAPLDTPGLQLQTIVTKAVNSYVMVDVAAGKIHITAKDDSGSPIDDAEWSVAK